MSRGRSYCDDDSGFSRSTRYAKYVYASANGNVIVTSRGETPLIKGVSDPRLPIYTCVKGNLEGFDPFSGIFKAPKTGFYDVTLFCNYYLHGLTKVNGRTYTKMAIFNSNTRTDFVHPLGSTNIFAPFQGGYISAASISGTIPLVEGDHLTVSLYQQNNKKQAAEIYAELTILQASPYGKDTNYSHVHMAPRIRCGKAEDFTSSYSLSSSRSFSSSEGVLTRRTHALPRRSTIMRGRDDNPTLLADIAGFEGRASTHSSASVLDEYLGLQEGSIEERKATSEEVEIPLISEGPAPSIIEEEKPGFFREMLNYFMENMMVPLAEPFLPIYEEAPTPVVEEDKPLSTIVERTSVGAGEAPERRISLTTTPASGTPKRISLTTTPASGTPKRRIALTTTPASGAPKRRISLTTTPASGAPKRRIAPTFLGAAEEGPYMTIPAFGTKEEEEAIIKIISPNEDLINRINVASVTSGDPFEQINIIMKDGQEIEFSPDQFHQVLGEEGEKFMIVTNVDDILEIPRENISRIDIVFQPLGGEDFEFIPNKTFTIKKM